MKIRSLEEKYKKKEYDKKRYLEKREELIAKSKEYHKKNPEVARKAVKKYYNKNREKEILRCKIYKQNSEKYKLWAKQYNKKYHEENRERLNEQSRQYTIKNYAKVKEIDNYLHNIKKEYRWMIDTTHCHCCDKDELVEIQNSKQILSVHHIDWDHNNNEYDNLICVCKSCHAKIHLNERGGLPCV